MLSANNGQLGHLIMEKNSFIVNKILLMRVALHSSGQSLSTFTVLRKNCSAIFDNKFCRLKPKQIT